MGFDNYHFTVDDDTPEGGGLTFTPLPDASRSHVSRRQPSSQPPALTPKEKAVVEEQRMRRLTIAAIEDTEIRCVDAKRDMFLQAADAYEAASSWVVDQKNAIANPEKRALYAGFCQQLLNELPAALQQSFAVGVSGVSRVQEEDMTTLVAPPEYQERVVEEEPPRETFIPVKFRHFLAGGITVDQQTGNRRRR